MKDLKDKEKIIAEYRKIKEKEEKKETTFSPKINKISRLIVFYWEIIRKGMQERG